MSCHIQHFKDELWYYKIWLYSTQNIYISFIFWVNISIKVYLSQVTKINFNNNNNVLLLYLSLNIRYFSYILWATAFKYHLSKWWCIMKIDRFSVLNIHEGFLSLRKREHWSKFSLFKNIKLTFKSISKIFYWYIFFIFLSINPNGLHQEKIWKY